MHLAEHISTSIIDVCLLKAHGYRTLLFFFCRRQPCVFSHLDSSDGTALQDYSLCSSLMMTLGTRSITLQWPHLWHSPREVPAPEGFLSFSCQRHSSDILYLKR